MSSYRKRFIVFNMALIFIVLLTVFSAVGVYMYKSFSSELKNTLVQIVMPMSEPNDNFRRIDDARPPFDKNGENQPPSQQGGKPDGEFPEMEPRDNERHNDENIMTVFYSRETGEISVLSGISDISSEDIGAIVKTISDKEEQYGTLDEYGIIYFKDTVGGMIKMAIAERSYIGSKMAVGIMWLSVIFVLSLGVFFGISVLLSKRAARPMEDAVKMERDFVANVSHDLKTPITIILANNSIIRQNPDSHISEQSQWIDSTDDAAKSMMNMVNEMLTLSSLESSDKKTERVPVDISVVAQKAVLQTESLAYERQITVEEDISDETVVMATPSFAERICSGLIENAIKYEPDGGRVSVTLKTEKRHAVLSVSNAGSFIGEEDIKHIFERFYRADKSRTERSGYGLGLPIIKEVADRIGAGISVSSARESGTVFTVTFDVCE